MVFYLILCRSQTYAQRMAAVLEGGGINCRVARVPRSIAGDGCGYCVRVAERHFAAANKLLREEGMTFKRVYKTNDEGGFEEVAT